MIEHRAPPERCDVCLSRNIAYTTEREATGSDKRLWPYVWHCRDCKATVGCHAGTNKPMGYMANGYVRHLRAELHSIVDPLWQSGLAKRTEIYAWIARELSIEFDFCHISQLSVSQLKIAIEFAQRYATINSSKIKENNRDLRNKRSRVKRHSRTR